MNSLIYQNYINTFGSGIATGNFTSLTTTNQLKERVSITGSFTVASKVVTPVMISNEDNDVSALTAVVKVTYEGTPVMQISLTAGSNKWATATAFTDTLKRIVPKFSYTDVSTGTTYNFNAGVIVEKTGSTMKINYLDSVGADFDRIETSDTFRVDFDYT